MRTTSPTNRSSAQPQPLTRITLRWRLPVFFLGVLLLTAVFLPSRVWNSLLVGLGGLLLIAYLWVRNLAQGLQAERRLRFAWVSVGDRLEELLTIRNKSFFPALWVEVQDESNVPGYTAAVVRSVAGQSEDRWRQTAVCTQRGQFRLGPWQIQSGDPFGLFTVTHRYPATAEIIIHPPIHGQLPIDLPAGQSSGRARRSRHAWQANLNAATIREYQTSDPFNRIHWPSSARRDQLLVRQFDEDAGGDLWLILDLQTAVQLGHGIDGTEEQIILLAAALAAQAIQQTRKVGLAAYGRSPQIIPTGQGEGQQWNLLRALALAQADGTADLTLILRDVGRIARRGTTAVIITPTPHADWIPELLTLARHGVQSSVILLDRASFGGATDSSGLRDAVRQYGFTAYLIRQGEIGTPLETAVRRGFWEFKVSPTGRAIPVKSPTTGDR